MIKVKGIESEDFVNYKKCSMFIALGICDWKCCKEAGIPISVCQNSKLGNAPCKNISIEAVYNIYKDNPLTEAVVIGGLEPFTQLKDIIDLLKYFRDSGCEDDFVIYTGYYPHEVNITELEKYSNVIIKYGRYIPNNEPHLDEILGVNLVSDNQYAVKIS